ncbi:ComF family protein [Actinotalea sp.]|uniref:ComF family protein n=1 Tax=Actinotalea sp. TaxID=1872145 RepID=UPI003568509C
MATTARPASPFVELARLVLPASCPGCGTPDVPLCPGCARSLLGPVRRVEDGAPRLDHLDGTAVLPVWSAAAYSGPVRGIVPAWKDGRRADLTPVLTSAMARCAAVASRDLAPAADGRAVQVVPVPSRPGVRRRRGADLVGLLAAACAAELRTRGVDARVVVVLGRRRGRDQVGLGARDRGLNLSRALRLRGRPCGLFLLVDDVVTTGATLAACEEALAGGGGLVLGALVVAATPRITRAPLSTSGQAG